MVSQLKSLYLEGKVENFLEGVKELTDDSIDAQILKLLAKSIRYKLEKQEEILKEAKELERQTEDSENLSYIGLIFTIIAEFDEAKRVLQKAVEKESVSAYAYYRLGNVYLIESDFTKAEELIKKGLELEEKSEAWHNLGFLYEQVADEENSLKAYKRGWELKPFRLGLAQKAISAIKKYASLDEFEDELEKRVQACEDEKEKCEYLARLGLVKFEKEDFKDSLIKLNQAIRLNEDDEELRALYAHFMLREERYWILGQKLVEWVEKYDVLREHFALAECRIEAGFLEKAKEGLDNIKDRVESEKLEYELLLARYYKENNEHDKAKEILEKLFEEYPSYVPVVNMLSDLYNSLGETDKSLEILENLGKDAVGVLIRRIDAKKEISQDDLNKLEEYLEEIDDEELKANINFGLANGYDKLKDYDKASHHLKRANEIIYKKLDYSIEDFRKEIDELINTYSAQWLEGKQNGTKFDKRPIFIVGMPRSGTTMLEQIFAAHELVFGAGELPYAQKIIRLSETITKKEYPNSFATAPRKLLKEAGEYYIYLTKKMYNFDEPVFVDKLPHNFMHSALLLAMFPDAKVIALRRDYRAIALSNYFQNFAAKRGTLGYAFDLEAMGEHIKDYIRIMEYYKSILPTERYREFWYEDLVLNPKDKIPEVLEFCELDFTPEVLEFYKNKTAVKTASILQVRNPIYTKSAQKWKNYADLLSPVMEIVGDRGVYEG